MKIDLTCPVELWQYAMPAEDASECTFVMNNLSDKVVTSIQVTLACFDREDMLLFRQTERIQGLKAAWGSGSASCCCLRNGATLKALT